MDHETSNQIPAMTPFWVIWTGQALSMVGTRAAQFALVWWLTRQTGSATVLAVATMMAMLPQVILGPLAGAYIDRWNRRWVMMAADALAAIAALGLGYLFWAGMVQVWHIYLLMLVRAAGETFHWPAMQASTSLMVPKKHLARVAGINQAMQGALTIVAPPLGALLLAAMPMHNIMGIDVGTALFAIVPLFFVRVPQPQRTRPRPDAPDGGASVWADMRDGFAYVWNWPGLALLLLIATILNFVLNPAFALLPLLVTQYFHGEALHLGWLEATWGGGVILGGLFLGAWGGFERRIYTTLTGLFILGLGVILLGMIPAHAFWAAVVTMAIIGLTNPLVNGPIFAILQTVVAPDMQGRVFTLVGSLAAAMSPLSLAVAGPVADAVGIRPWYIVGGLYCVLVGLGGFFIPAIVNIETNYGQASKLELPSPAGVEAAAFTD